MFSARTTTPSFPIAVGATIPVSRWTSEDQLAKDQYHAEVRSQLNGITRQTDALLDRHATKRLASPEDVLTAIKAQAAHSIVVKETVDRLMKSEHCGLRCFVERAGVLLKAAQESRSEDPGASTQRRQRYLDELMSLNRCMLSIAVKDLTSDGTEPESPCPDEIVIPGNVAQFGYLIGKLRGRCLDRDQGIKAQRLTAFHHRWRVDLKKPDALAELQGDFRALCAAIRIAESPRLLGLPWLGFASHRGRTVLTIASAPPQSVDRHVGTDAAERTPV
ncbi:hypothetical protein [Roseateles noduli]|uniref:hypothetical protein n=1 Tax=Roseateles noduli TaxID=2052484 RepID=UPI003D65887A